MKTVDKYQFNESDSIIQNGIETFNAFHTVLKKHFTLRRVIHTDPNSAHTHNILLKEAAVLKNISHQGVYRCHKMLKTKTHMYLVYDSIEGVSLGKLPTNTLNTLIKVSLLKKVCSVLLELSQMRICHGQLQPNEIIMQEDSKLKICGFGCSVEILAGKDKVKLEEEIPQQECTAPEIIKGQAWINSDVYSLGIIINKLFETEFKANKELLSVSNKSFPPEFISTLKAMTQKMLVKVPQERIQIQEICAFLDNKSKIEKDKSVNSSRSTLRPGGKEQQTQKKPSPRTVRKLQIPQLEKTSLGQRSSNTLLRSTENGVRSLPESEGPATPTTPNRSRTQIQASSVSKYINKRRKLAMILCLMGQNCLQARQVSIPISVNMAFILVKKATVLVTQLAKIIKTGQGLDIKVDDKQRQNFLRSSYCLKIGPVIEREMAQVKDTFSLLCSRIKKVPQSAVALKEEIRSANLSNNALRKCASDFMNQLDFTNHTYYASIVSQQHLVCIYLASLLSIYDTYEEAFDELLCDSTGSFLEQPLVRELLALQKLQIIQLIQMNMQIQYKENEQSKLLIKSVRTLNS